MGPPELPRVLSEAIRNLVEASGLSGTAARELRSDLEEHARDGLAAGRDPQELAARLGSPSQVASRLADSRPPAPRRPDPGAGEGPVSALLTDLRLAGRMLTRSPGLAVAAVAILGLGIAATAAAFTVVNEIFLRALPVSDPERLVDVWATEPGGNSFAGFGWRDVLAYRESVGGDGPVEDLAAFAGFRTSLGEEGAGARPVVGQLVTEEYFPLLGVPAELGSVNLSEDPGFQGPRAVVLSHATWQDAFAADRAIVGRSLFIGGEAFTVVGVAAAGFHGHFIGFPVDLWIPITAADLVMAGFDPVDRSQMPFEMIGRLRDGAAVAAAEEALNAVARRLEVAYPDTHRGHRVGVTPTTGVDHSLQPVVLAFVTVLTVLASLVLLVACLNVGSLLLVRTLAREGELAVRSALGAGRGRLIRQLLTEALLLTGLAAVVGIAGSRLLTGGVDAVLRGLAPGLGLALPFDGRVLLLTIGAATLAALVAGGAPALHVLRRAPGQSLRARPARPGSARVRGLLVGGQVAVSVALVITAGLFARALGTSSRVDPGFAADEVASFVPASEEMERTEYAALLQDLRDLPTVSGAALADGPPVGVARTPVLIRVPGMEPPPGEDGWTVDARRVGSGYLETVGVPVVRGRDLEPRDDREGGAVTVVSQAFVDRFWPEADPVGRILEVEGRPVTVVGVAGDARTLVQDEAPDPFLYLSLGGLTPVPPVVTLRSRDPEALATPVREVVSLYAPDGPAPRLVPARETLDSGLLAQRLGLWLVGSLGGVALLLAVVGLYGLLQYSVSRDRQAFAIRLALGGPGRDVLTSVLRTSLALVGAGIAGGFVLAALGSPALSSFLPGVTPRDPLTFTIVAVLFLTVALVASILPARRALSIPPAAVLRGE